MFRLTMVLLLMWLTNVPAKETNLGNISTDAGILNEWITVDKRLKTAVNSAIKSVLPSMLDAVGRLNLTSECSSQTMKLFFGLKSLELWALKFIDSTGKIVDGMLEGTATSMGNYDECMDIVVTKGPSERYLFRGKYCILKISRKMPEVIKFSEIENEVKATKQFRKSLSEMTQYLYSQAKVLSEVPFSWAICVPSGCSSDDVGQLVQIVGDKFAIKVEVGSCEVKSEPVYDTSTIIGLFFYGLALLLVLVGTLLELYSKYCNVHFESVWWKILLAFSLIHNLQKLLKTKKSEENLNCLHGFRFLSIAWIIICHRFLFSLGGFQVHANYTRTDSFLRLIGGQIILNGFLAVDTFFWMSGLLLSYVGINSMKGSPRNMIFMIIHRLWRIFPTYVFTILITFIFHLITWGPFAQELCYPFKTNCETYWWRNILFINNFFDQALDLCVPQAWYLSSDFQLFLFALLVLALLSWQPKKGIALSIVVVLASMAYSGIWTWTHQLLPTFILHNVTLETMKSSFLIYSKPFAHAQVYFIGFMLGYALRTKKDWKFSKESQILGWIVSTVLGCVTLLVTVVWNRGKEPTVWESVLYSSLSKTAFALSISWVFLCCVKGYGGYVNSILSWKAWLPLSRLSFGAYLLSPIVQEILICSSKVLMDSNVLHIVWRSIADIFFSFLAALALSLLVEGPFMSMEKIIFFKREEHPKKLEAQFVNNGVELNANAKAENSLETNVKF